MCSEMWPGNTADVTSLVPVIDRLRRRFAIGRVCVVADRGMISAETIAAARGARPALHSRRARAHRQAGARRRARRCRALRAAHRSRSAAEDIDYEAKAVTLAGRRYIVCRNHQEAEKDAADRAAILAALERQLRKGDKALVGNTGYRRFLKTVGDDHFAIDRAKADEDAKFDGIFVLRTNTDLNPLEAMLLLQATLDGRADLPHGQASARNAADLPQARRDHSRPRVLQLPRPRARRRTGGPHRRARPHRGSWPARSSPISTH